MMWALRTWLADERGASAAEVGLLLTPLTLLVFGSVHLCLLMYTASQLNYAAEATARCMVTSANSGQSTAPCYSSTLATSYFTGQYHGVTAAPTLTFCDGTFSHCTSGSVSNCITTPTASGYQVIATANYVINAGIVSKTVPLTAKACFPHT